MRDSDQEQRQGPLDTAGGTGPCIKSKGKLGTGLWMAARGQAEPGLGLGTGQYEAEHQGQYSPPGNSP